MLYLQINGQILLLANIANNQIRSHKTIKLPPHTINDGVIFNPQNILIHINEFIHIYIRPKTSTIINAPDLLKKEGIYQTLAAFQFALILSKADIKIQKIIATPTPATDLDNQQNINALLTTITNTAHPNLLEQLQTKTSSHPLVWLGTTIAGIGGLACLLLSISQNRLTEINNFTQANTQLQAAISQMQAKNTHLANLRNKNTSITSIINKYHNYVSQKQNPLEHMTLIASNIPNNVWLSKFEMGDSSKNKNWDKYQQPSKTKSVSPKLDKIELMGYSFHPNSPLKFMEKLCPKTNLFNTLMLTYLKKLKTATGRINKPKASEIKYEFKISGNLTE